MAVVFSNNATTALASSVTSSATSITVQDGSVFPTLSGSDYTYITLEDLAGNVEIVKLTARSVNVLTIVRAQDGTSARAFGIGSKCELRLTAALLNEVAAQADTDTNTTYTAGSGLALTGTVFSNTSPDRTVALTGAGATSISGTYPNFTITSTDTNTVYTHPSAHPISFITGLQAALDGKVDDSQVLTNVPAGALFTDTVYTLPFADNSANWNTAYGWGDHAGNYLPLAGGTLTGDLTLAKGTTEKQAYHNLYIGGADLSGADSAIYIGNAGAGSGYGWELFYNGAGSGNLNKLIIRAENLGNPVDALSFNQDGAATFGNTIAATGGNSTNWNTAYGWGNHASQSYATQSYVGTAISNLVDSSPATLDTLNELAAALGDDPNFATTVTNSIATKLPLTGGTLTGALKVTDGWVNVSSNVGGSTPSDVQGLHVGWNKSNGGREVNMVFNGGAGLDTAEMIFSGHDGTTYSDIFQIDGTGGVRVLSGDLKIGSTTVIDSSRNLTNIGTISSGAITSTGDISANSGKVRMGNPTLLSGRSSIRIDSNGDSFADLVFGDDVTSTSWANANWAISSRSSSESNSLKIYRGSGQPSPYDSEHVLMEFKQNNVVSVNSTLQINNTTVIDSSRNLTNIGSISSSNIHNTGVLWLGSTATANDQFAVNSGTDIFIGTSAKGLRTYKDLHTNSGNNKYWHAGNDGSGSGLDADLLDGQQETAFLKVSLGNAADLSASTYWRAGMFGWYDGTANRPPDNFGQGLSIVSAGSEHNNSNNWITQLAFGTNETTSYFRSKTNAGGWGAWHTIWNSANDGSGSGLDADLLDGQHGSYYAPASHGHSYLPLTGGTLTGTLVVNSTSDAQITLTSADSWTGIGFNDGAALGAEYIWHNGGNGTFAIGGGGSNVANKKLHVHGGMTIGSGYAATSVTGNSLSVEGNITATRFRSANGTIAPLSSSFTFSNVFTSEDSSTRVAYFDGNGGNASVWWGNGANAHAALDSSDGLLDVWVNPSNGSWYNIANFSTSGLAITTGGLSVGGNTVWNAGNDGSGSGLDADLLDGIQGTNLRKINSEYSGSVGADGWYTIAEYGSGRAQGEFYIYDNDSSRHNFVKIDASWSYGNGGITCTANGKHGILTIQHVRFLYNTSDQTYGGCKLQVYCANAAWTLRVRQMPSQMDGWGAFTQVTPVLANSVTSFAQHSAAVNVGLGGGFSTSALNWYAAGNLVWNAGNDGSGSGLDADLLDGQHGSYYYPASNPSGYNNYTHPAYTARSLDTTGAQVLDILTTDAIGSVTNATTRTMTLADLGYTGATNANYITNNNQLTNGAGYVTPTGGVDYLRSNIGISSSSGQYWQASGQTTTYAPTGGWWNTWRGSHGDPVSYYSNTLAIAMTDSDRGTIYTQTIQGGTLTGWNKFWHSNNDGSGSGLDADLLDGQQGSYYYSSANPPPTDSQYIRSNANDTATGSITFDQASQYFRKNAQTNYGNASLLAESYGGGATKTGVGFHISGSIGKWVNMDANGVLRWDGDTFWHTGNDGSGSGLDADLLDGLNSTSFVRSDTNTNLASGHKWTFISGGAGTSFGANHYSMGVDIANGGWTGPNYSDLIIGYHTGIRIGAAYGGTRFYANSPTTDANNDGNGDGGETLLMTVGGVPTGGNGVRIENTLTVGGVTNSNSYSVGAASANGRLINGSWGFRHQTDSGYIEFGPANTTWAHIYTDRPNFYFNTNLFVNNALVWHSGNDGSGSGLDADLLDGQQPSALSVNYANSANSATSAGSLPTLYAGGQQTNPQVYFNYLTGLKVAMTGYPNVWSDTLWINGYSGGDVENMCALHLIRNGQPRMWISSQSNRGTSYGTAYEFWSSYNDGSGSGLDADLLDGYNSDNFLGKFGNSYYQANTWIQLTAEHGLYMPSINNAHFYPNGVTSYGTWRIIGSRNGYTGIHLDHGNVTTAMYDGGGNGGEYNSNWGWYTYFHRGDGCLGVAGSSTSSSYGLYEQGGGIYSTGNVVAYSDRRVKENIRTIDNALETVEQMRGVYYNRIDDEEKKTVIGFIAQEVDEVEGAKPLVTYAADVDQYGVSYGNATALLVEAIKELSQQVKDLQKEIKELKNA